MNTTKERKARVARLKEEYDLTPRQSKYVEISLEEPELTVSERARAAGYPESTRTTGGGRVLKSPSIKRAIEAEAARIAQLAEEDYKKTQIDPAAHIEKKLWEHSHNPTITPNQTRALELIGKIHGTFVDRMEVAVGEHHGAIHNLLAAAQLPNLIAKEGEFTETPPVTQE